jgi:endonuclease III
MTDPEPGLLQLRFLDDPYAFGVACILLNRTSRRQVDRVIDDLLLDYPTAEAMTHARADELRRLLTPLGFGVSRAERLRRFSEDLSAGMAWEDCHGIGRYASDSRRLLVEDDLMCEPEDKELRRWLRWRVAQRV